MLMYVRWLNNYQNYSMLPPFLGFSLDFQDFSIFGNFSKRLFWSRAQISANGFFDNVRKFLMCLHAASSILQRRKKFAPNLAQFINYNISIHSNINNRNIKYQFVRNHQCRQQQRKIVIAVTADLQQRQWLTFFWGIFCISTRESSPQTKKIQNLWKFDEFRDSDINCINQVQVHAKKQKWRLSADFGQCWLLSPFCFASSVKLFIYTNKTTLYLLVLLYIFNLNADPVFYECF